MDSKLITLRQVAICVVQSFCSLNTGDSARSFDADPTYCFAKFSRSSRKKQRSADSQPENGNRLLLKKIRIRGAIRIARSMLFFSVRSCRKLSLGQLSKNAYFRRVKTA